MNVILLFLLNLSGSIGPTWGYYSPSFDSLNKWLYRKFDNIGQMRTTSMTIGANARVHLLKYFPIELGVDYYKAGSKDKMRSLTLIPVDAYLSYKHMLFPIFLYSYVGAGYGVCLIKYQDEEEALEEGGWASGPLVKGGLEFIPTPRLAIEISVGYRYEKASDIDLEDPGPPVTNIPINLWGGYIKATLERSLR